MVMMWLYCQGLPRQVPPDHMCHPWPISRVMSRAQNFALKSQISLPNKSLRTLWTFFPLRPIMGHEICWTNILAENWDPVTPNRLHFFLRTLVFSSAELSIQAYGSAELIFWFCVVDFCWFNGFSLGFLLEKKNIGGTQHHKMCAWVLLILDFFRRESINLVMHYYPWFPAACSFPNVKFNLYQPPWQMI